MQVRWVCLVNSRWLELDPFLAKGKPVNQCMFKGL